MGDRSSSSMFVRRSRRAVTGIAIDRLRFVARLNGTASSGIVVRAAKLARQLVEAECETASPACIQERSAAITAALPSHSESALPAAN